MDGATDVTTGDEVSRLRARVAKIANVVESTSRFGRDARLAWRVGSREIAHLHAADIVDIRVPAPLQRQWRTDPRVIPRPRRSDWIECRFACEDDVEFAASLIAIAARSARALRRRD